MRLASSTDTEQSRLRKGNTKGILRVQWIICWPVNDPRTGNHLQILTPKGTQTTFRQTKSRASNPALRNSCPRAGKMSTTRPLANKPETQFHKPSFHPEGVPRNQGSRILTVPEQPPVSSKIGSAGRARQAPKANWRTPDWKACHPEKDQSLTRSMSSGPAVTWTSSCAKPRDSTRESRPLTGDHATKRDRTPMKPPSSD
jgi:hypothetical protein